MTHSHHHHEHEHGHDHDHDHPHGHDHKPASSGVSGVPASLGRAILITSVFMLMEFAGGYFANSLALISDAAHMLTDLGAMLLSLFVYWVSRRPVTSTMSFGYHRAEILGALASGLVIWVLAGTLVYEAFLRLQAPPEVRGPLVLGIATVGLLANLLSMRMLHHSHSFNLNVRAAYLHLLTDCIGSVGAMVAGAVLWWTGWRPIDPIVTLLSAALMVFSSWELVKESVSVLMESTPSGLKPEAVRIALQKVAGVVEVHDLHIWAVSSGRLALSVHLVASETEQQVLSHAHQLLQSEFGIIHTTIQVEHPDRFQSQRCYDCAPS